MSKPNFFIIGAPKCGTTSLYHWLSEHPQVYMSPVKEPHFFSVDIYRPDRIQLKEYLRLFDEANPNHKIIGEASTRYLFSTKAVDNILDFNSDAKFIVMLRNPIDMVYSLHNHLYFLGVENQANFRSAWRLSDERATGKHIPSTCNDPDSLNYKKIGLLGKQIERFLKKVPFKARHVIVLDDLKKNKHRALIHVLNFLNIEMHNPNTFQKLNKSMAIRSEAITRLIKIMSEAKRITGIRKSLGILSKLSKFNRITKKREAMPEDLREELIEYFTPDIKLLADLIGRDLTFWCEL